MVPEGGRLGPPGAETERSRGWANATPQTTCEVHADSPVSSLPNSSSRSLCSPVCASSRPSPSIVIHTPTVCHARPGALRLSICCCIAPGTRTVRTLPTHGAWANNAPACHSPMPVLAHPGPPFVIHLSTTPPSPPPSLCGITAVVQRPTWTRTPSTRSRLCDQASDRILQNVPPVAGAPQSAVPLPFPHTLQYI